MPWEITTAGVAHGMLTSTTSSDGLPDFELQIAPALTVLTKLIYSLDDEVLIDACWAISYLSDGTNDKIEAVIESGVCRRLVDLLMCVEPRAEDEGANMLSGTLPPLFRHLRSDPLGTSSPAMISRLRL